MTGSQINAQRNFAVSPIVTNSNFQFMIDDANMFNRSAAQSFQTPFNQKSTLIQHQLGELSDPLKKLYIP